MIRLRRRIPVMKIKYIEAYEEGCDAYFDKFENPYNPYSDADKCLDWERGYNDTHNNVSILMKMNFI